MLSNRRFGHVVALTELHALGIRKVPWLSWFGVGASSHRNEALAYCEKRPTNRREIRSFEKLIASYSKQEQR